MAAAAALEAAAEAALEAAAEAARMGRRADRATAPGCSAVGLADGDSPVGRSDGLSGREGDRWPGAAASTVEAARVRRRRLDGAAESAEDILPGRTRHTKVARCWSRVFYLVTLGLCGGVRAVCTGLVKEVRRSAGDNVVEE